MMELEATLDHNETWERPISYKLTDPGDDQKLGFSFTGAANFHGTPYRDLHLWVDVSSAGLAGESLAERFRLI